MSGTVDGGYPSAPMPCITCTLCITVSAPSTRMPAAIAALIARPLVRGVAVTVRVSNGDGAKNRVLSEMSHLHHSNSVDR